MSPAKVRRTILSLQRILYAQANRKAGKLRSPTMGMVSSAKVRELGSKLAATAEKFEAYSPAGLLNTTNIYRKL